MRYETSFEVPARYRPLVIASDEKGDVYVL